MSPDRPQRDRSGGLLVRAALSGLLAAGASWLIAAKWPAPAVDRATLASVAFVPIWTSVALAWLAWSRGARSGGARRRLVGLHLRWGGALALIALVMFGSGVGALLDRSLAAWQLGFASADANLPSLAEQPLDRVLVQLLDEHPELREGELSLRPASSAQPWIQADFFGPSREHVRVDFDPRTGGELGRGEGPLAVLTDLHRHLLITPWVGEPLLGLVGVGLSLVLLAGLATRRDWLRGLVDMLRGRARSAPLAMRAHQWLGFAALPPALVWAWSGAMLGLTLIVVPIVAGGAYQGDRATLMREVLAVDRPAPILESRPLPDLAAIATQRCTWLDGALPDASVDRFMIRQPGLVSGNVRVDLVGEGLRARGSFTVAGEHVRECHALPRAGLGLQTFMIAISLHFGGWGARAIELIYLALGVGLIALAWLGGGLAIRKRDRSGEHVQARRMTRARLGVGLGLALASAALLTLSRVPELAREEGVATALFLATWAGALLFAWIGEPDQRRRDLLVGLAVLLLVTPLLGWLGTGLRPGAVEAVLLVLGLVALRLSQGQD